MQRFTEKIEQYIRLHALLSSGDRVCVGLSGGADSVALLLTLLELRQNFSDLTISAVHINHRLRGAESDADEAFVRTLCEAHGVDLEVFPYDVAHLAATWQVGSEEAGRACRRHAFAEMVRMHGVTKIALAHHANDLAETFLFQTVRGSSLAGLSGIHPMTIVEASSEPRWESFGEPFNQSDSYALIHPLLGVERAEIETFLRARRQAWCTDRTNLETVYTRNKLRSQVLPYLESEINPHAVQHIREACEDIAQADAILRTLAEAKKATYVTVTKGNHPEVHIAEALLREADLLQRYLLMETLEAFAGSRKDLAREHLEALQSLLRSGAGKRRSLPYGVRAIREYAGIVLYKKPEGAAGDGTEAEALPVAPGTYRFQDWQIRMRFVPQTELEGSKIPENRYTKWFDYDKIISKPILRNRKSGDRICTRADGSTKKLKDFMIDAKIPARLRDDLLVLAAGNRVFWVVGYRMSEDCKVTDQTERILEIGVSACGGVPDTDI